MPRYLNVIFIWPQLRRLLDGIRDCLNFIWTTNKAKKGHTTTILDYCTGWQSIGL